MPPQYSMQGVWAGYVGGPDADVPEVDTARAAASGCSDLLDAAHATCPTDFNVAPEARSACSSMRREHGATGKRPLDWGTGETLAFASLVAEGTRVRLTRPGRAARHVQPPPRGAVRRRDRRAATRRSRTSATDQARFEVWDSPLSEAGVLGFEYGYSLDSPGRARDLGGAVRRLRERRAGDHRSVHRRRSEDKWHRLSGLVLLLPHGFEGQGPEHSSARLERFLQLVRRGQHPGLQPDDAGAALPRAAPPGAAPVAQAAGHHVARRACCARRTRSRTLDELAHGALPAHHPGRDASTPAKVKRVLLCSGKVYYDLLERAPRARPRRRRDRPPRAALPAAAGAAPRGARALRRRHAARLGPGRAVEHGRLVLHARALPDMLEGRLPLSCVSRPESASPATGSMGAHKIEQARVIDGAFCLSRAVRPAPGPQAPGLHLVYFAPYHWRARRWSGPREAASLGRNHVISRSYGAHRRLRRLCFHDQGSGDGAHRRDPFCGRLGRRHAGDRHPVHGHDRARGQRPGDFPGLSRPRSALPRAAWPASRASRSTSRASRSTRPATRPTCWWR